MHRLTPYIKDISNATYFYIQNVCDYYFEVKDEEAWTTRDFTVAPPFPLFATKYTLPDDMPPEYQGVDILSVFRVVNETPIRKNPNRHVYGPDINAAPPFRVGKWQIEVDISSATGKRANPPVKYLLGVDEHGQIPRTPTGPAFWVLDFPGDSKTLAIVPNTMIQVSLLALTFLNCRNVEMLPAYPEPRRRKAKKREPEIKYHQLKVKAIGQKRESNGRAGKGGKKSLHIVRGHFREYGTEGKGKLFGKYTGRYWVATHTAGDVRQGITTKDYEVER